MSDNELVIDFIGILPKYETDKVYWSNFDFSSNWDVLMIIVDKIENVESEEYGRFPVYISSNHCHIQSTKTELDNLGLLHRPKYSDDYYGEDKIDAVYNMCIRFIKWFNNENT